MVCFVWVEGEVAASVELVCAVFLEESFFFVSAVGVLEGFDEFVWLHGVFPVRGLVVLFICVRWFPFYLSLGGKDII